MSSQPLLLVRQPSPRLSEGILTHLSPRTADPPTHARSLAQWKVYVDVFRQRGWDVVEVQAADECPDGVFIEDAVVVFPGEPGVVMLVRSGSEERRKEYATAKRAVEEHLVKKRGFELVDFYDDKVDPTGHATMDGGDVLKVAKEKTVYVGLSGRTNKEGVEVIKREMGIKRGWKVVTVDMGGKGWLHLKSATTALPSGSQFLLAAMQGGASRPDSKTLRIKEEGETPWIEVAEDEGVAVVELGGKDVLLSSSAPRTKAQLEEQGWNVITADVADFEALEGCVTCLSVRVR